MRDARSSSTKVNASRRDFMRGSAGVIFAFSLRPGYAAPLAVQRPGDLQTTPLLDAWIRIDPDSSITVFTGKAELGQGIKTAVIQVAAEELEVRPESIRLVTADTARTPNEGMTAGSHSMQDSATAIRNAAAQVRDLLMGTAAARWRIDPAALHAADGVVRAQDGRSLRYGELISDQLLHVAAKSRSRLKQPPSYQIIGKPFRRVDIPAKVTGGAAYVQDIRLPGMVHGRIIQPPAPGATLLSVESSEVERLPGVLKVVRDGSFLGVLATGEYEAIRAMRALSQASRWSRGTGLPNAQRLPEFLRQLPSEDGIVVDQKAQIGSAAIHSIEAAFTRAYQCHGSIGPSCAVAWLQQDAMTVWTHCQGVFPNRDALAQMLGMPTERVRCIHAEGSGCYGHNGADDVAADAALLARALPGRPVRVQWMREQEHRYEPFGPAMLSKVRASMDSAGKIIDWQYELWSNTHLARPGPAGALLSARLMARPFPPEEPRLQISPEGSGDRNAVPLYSIPNKRAVWHFLKEAPLRVSALRSLGAYMNVFSIEATIEALAAAADMDPVKLRLANLQNDRASQVIKAAADAFGWAHFAAAPNHGRGFGFAQYKNLAAYCAVAIEVEVEPESGRVSIKRAVAAVDSGEIVNPDGIRNQIEGGIIQSISWTLFESVRFDEQTVTSIDWATYPIARFASVPDAVDVRLIDRPGLPFLGAGEAAQGPAAAAVVNAITDAARRRGAAADHEGPRLRDIPVTGERIRALFARRP